MGVSVHAIEPRCMINTCDHDCKVLSKANVFFLLYSSAMHPLLTWHAQVLYILLPSVPVRHSSLIHVMFPCSCSVHVVLSILYHLQLECCIITPLLGHRLPFVHLKILIYCFLVCYNQLLLTFVHLQILI